MILASCRGMGAFQAMPGVIVTTSSTMQCCDGNCVRRWPLTYFGSYRPGPYPHKLIGKGVCVRDVCAIFDNNISPSLLMIIIKIIILYFIQIRHTDAFPPTGTLLVNTNLPSQTWTWCVVKCVCSLAMFQNWIMKRALHCLFCLCA